MHPARAEQPSDLALAMSEDAAAALPRSKAQAVVIVGDDTPAGCGLRR